jgi:sucrose-6-phosphate hydrolase SacC (GH32 family)
VPDQEEPQAYDLGEHAIGPSGMVDPQGRLIVFTIAWGGFKKTQIYDLGWVHNAALPVIVKLREDGQLGVEPLPELQSLRQKELVAFEEKTQEEANRLLEGVGGKMLEIFVQFEAKSSGQYGLKVCATPDGEEETLIYFDTASSTLKINRNRSSRDPDLEHKETGGELPLAEQSLQLHIFVDHSMLEVYANGLKSLTTRVYPVREDAVGLRLWAENPIGIDKLQVWQLGSSYQY